MSVIFVVEGLDGVEYEIQRKGAHWCSDNNVGLGCRKDATVTL